MSTAPDEYRNQWEKIEKSYQFPRTLQKAPPEPSSGCNAIKKRCYAFSA